MQIALTHRSSNKNSVVKSENEVWGEAFWPELLQPETNSRMPFHLTESFTEPFTYSSHFSGGKNAVLFKAVFKTMACHL